MLTINFSYHLLNHSAQKANQGRGSHAEHLGNFAITQALRPQFKTSSFLGRQAGQGCLKPFMALSFQYRLLGIWSRIELLLTKPIASPGIAWLDFAIIPSLIQGQIVSHPEDPGSQVILGLAFSNTIVHYALKTM